ncbi:MAG: trehalose-phosphatase, partial [Burkholderia sp.]|nr:trehalose-phosphatase [Burkholderia sp.]
RNGLSIKVGAGDTTAQARVESVTALLDWLATVVAAARGA